MAQKLITQEDRDQAVAMANLSTNVGNLTTKVEDMHEDWKEFKTKLPKMFAAKWTEKIVSGIVGIILLAVGSAIVAGVIQAAEVILN